MAGPYVRSLAAGHTKIAIFATKPGATDTLMAAIPIATITGTGVLDAAPRILASDFKLGADDDDTVNEPALSEETAADVPTHGKLSGMITAFRYFSSLGVPEVGSGGDLGDAVFQAIKTKGTTLWIARRDTSKLSGDSWATGDPYEIYEVITGTPQQTPLEGYIKNPVKLFPQKRWVGTVAA